MINNRNYHKGMWQTKKLGEICDVYQPKTISAKEMVLDGKYVVFGANGVIGRYDKYNHDEPQLLITCRGATCGSVNISTPKSWITGNAMVIRPIDRSLEIKYLEYIFRGGLDMSKVITGAAQPQITRTSLEPVEISYPESISEQNRIVKILDGVFEKIGKAKENTEKNLQNSRELFESYLQSVLESKGEDWEEKKLGEVCQLTRGHNPPKSKFINELREGYVRFYQIRDGWSDDYAVYVPDTTQLHRVLPDEILMVAYRHIGKVFRGVSGAFNVALCKISNIRKDILDNDFLFYLIPTDIIKGELMKRSGRSLIPSMSVEHLKELVIPLPPLSEQKIIVKKLNELSEQTKRLEEIYKQKLGDLEELKKSILSKAFAGEL